MLKNMGYGMDMDSVPNPSEPIAYGHAHIIHIGLPMGIPIPTPILVSGYSHFIMLVYSDFKVNKCMYS